MEPFFVKIEAAIWLAWIVSWNLAALWRTKSSVILPRRDYRIHLMIVIVGMLLVFGVWPRGGPYLWPASPAFDWAMIGVTVVGFGFAWWARIDIGRMWSGGIERTADHRVVDRGAYAVVRHPIYTGMIAAAFAMALIWATPWALAGAMLFAFGFYRKALVEERFLERELGGYDEYRRRVPMLVPLLRRT